MKCKIQNTGKTPVKNKYGKIPPPPKKKKTLQKQTKMDSWINQVLLYICWMVELWKINNEIGMKVCNQKRR